MDFLNINQTRYNPFSHDDLIRLQEFGLKKSIKRRFESNFKQNLAEGRCNRISLVLHSYTFLLHSKHVKKNVQNITHNESVKYNYATYLVHYLQLILYLFCTFVQYIFFL